LLEIHQLDRNEILKLRVREINFKLAGDKVYAEISVNGKTGSRIIPLFSSIPFIKDWLNNHSQHGNPNACLIPSFNRAAFCRKLAESSLNRIYHRYKTKMFPGLLNDENVPIEDKNKIQQLLKKPWNPYIRRALNPWNIIGRKVPCRLLVVAPTIHRLK